VTSFLSASSSNDSQDPLYNWRQLTLAIRANPKKLPTHTQRIMLAMDIQLQPYLSGALQDFFITLKDTGYPLKEKMLHLSSPLLESSSRAYFMQWLNDNSDSHLECVRYAGATLVSDSCQQLSVDNEAEDMQLLENFLNKNYDNPIGKAEYCVAYGCIEKGQELLEAEILSHKKHSPLVEQALLSIYYHSQNKDALNQMTQHLQRIDRALSEDWKKIQSLAKEW